MEYIIVAAIGLVLVIEGILPFAAPKMWKRMVILMANYSDRMLRITGLVLMCLGLVIVIIAHLYL